MRKYIEEHNKRVREARKGHAEKKDSMIGRAMIVIVACLAVILITSFPRAFDRMWEQQYEKPLEYIKEIQSGQGE